MTTKHRALTTGLKAALLTTVMGVAGQGAWAQDGKAITTVVKISGIPWFDRMETGVKMYAEQHPEMTIIQVGPGHCRLCSAVADRPGLGGRGRQRTGRRADGSGRSGRAAQARHRPRDHRRDARGRQPGQHDGQRRGVRQRRVRHCAERAAGGMHGQEGKWTTFVGSLGSRTHMQWVGAGEENATQYPGMELVDPNNESFDDANGTYEKAKEILRKHPDIKGFQTSAGQRRPWRRSRDRGGRPDRSRSVLWAPDCRTRQRPIWTAAPSRLSGSGTRKRPAWR